MGLFRKRAVLPPTAEERAGQWTRSELLRHWGTIPDAMKLEALSTATEDQLRVLGWDLPTPHDRFLAITEARQRRERPDLYRRIQDTGELSSEQFEEWTAPIREMHGRRVTDRVADQAYEEVFGPQQSLGASSQAVTPHVIGSPRVVIQLVREAVQTTMDPAMQEFLQAVLAPTGVSASSFNECTTCSVEGRRTQAEYWFVPMLAPDEHGTLTAACVAHNDVGLETTRDLKYEKPFTVWIVTRDSGAHSLRTLLRRAMARRASRTVRAERSLPRQDRKQTQVPRHP